MEPQPLSHQLDLLKNPSEPGWYAEIARVVAGEREGEILSHGSPVAYFLSLIAIADDHGDTIAAFMSALNRVAGDGLYALTTCTTSSQVWTLLDLFHSFRPKAGWLNCYDFLRQVGPEIDTRFPGPFEGLSLHRKALKVAYAYMPGPGLEGPGAYQALGRFLRGYEGFGALHRYLSLVVAILVANESALPDDPWISHLYRNSLIDAQEVMTEIAGLVDGVRRRKLLIELDGALETEFFKGVPIDPAEAPDKQIELPDWFQAEIAALDAMWHEYDASGKSLDEDCARLAEESLE